MSVFDRYADQAKRAIYFARLEAVHRNEPLISVNDLLVGLTWDEDSRASRLVPLKNTAVQIRAVSQIPHLPSTSSPYKRDAQIPLEDDAKRLLAYATAEADHDHEWWIDTDHLLRSFLRFENGATAIVRSLGSDLEQLRSASMQDRTTHPSVSTPKLKYAKDVAQRYWTTAVLIVVVVGILALVKWRG